MPGITSANECYMGLMYACAPAVFVKGNCAQKIFVIYFVCLFAYNVGWYCHDAPFGIPALYFGGFWFQSCFRYKIY
jgi:hypothetical protein